MTLIFIGLAMAFYNTNTHRSETGPLRQVIKRKVEEIDQICERVLKEQDDFCGSIYQNNDLLRIAKQSKTKANQFTRK